MKFSEQIHKLSKKLSPQKFNLQSRPYSDEEAKKLLANVMSPETSEWHYRKHHKGYVSALNKIEKELEEVNQKEANGNYSEFGELKRRRNWNHAGNILHNVYWDNLGGEGKFKTNSALGEAIKATWGSYSEWKKDFIATCMATKLSGWGVLVLDTLNGNQLINVLVDEHHYGAIWGGIPLIACDMFEHSYYHKDGPDRKTYINNFINNLHWERISEKYNNYFQNG